MYLEPMGFRKFISTPQDLALYRSSLVNQWHEDKEVSVAFRESRLYFFTEDMATIVGATEPNIESVEDLFNYLPSPTGIIYFESTTQTRMTESLTEGQVRGAYWQLNQKGEFTCNLLLDTAKMAKWFEGDLSASDIKSVVRLYGQAPMINDVREGAKIQIVDGKMPKFNAGTKYLAQRLILTSLALLSSQSLTAISPFGVNVPSGLKKQKVFKDVVNVVNVRNIRHVEASEEKGSKLTVRFIVGGHFRNQPYKSTGEIKKIFIDPYIKGPVGAPLKVSKPVYKF